MSPSGCQGPVRRPDPRTDPNKALREDFDRLKADAKREAQGAVIRYRQKARQAYLPTRINQKALAKLDRIFEETFDNAIERRMPELEKLNQQLGREDPRWKVLSNEDLRARPPHKYVA